MHTWPVEPTTVANHTSWQYCKFDLGITRNKKIAVLDWDGIVARKVVWRSPLWQQTRLPKSKLHAAVRLFIEDHKDKPIAEVVAEWGWHDLDVTTLQLVAKVLGIPIPKGSSWLQTLMIMTMHVLKCTEDEALTILACKFTEDLSRDHDCLVELWKVDEAVKCLSREDEKKLFKEREDTKKKVEVHQIFVLEWGARRRAVRDKANGIGVGKGKHKKVHVPLGPVKAFPVACEMMPQAEAKKLMPPRGYVWKSRGDSSWHTKVPPLPSCNRKVQPGKAGETAALRAVMRDAWTNYVLFEGLPEVVRPWKELLTKIEE